jgi:hypothetical protein
MSLLLLHLQSLKGTTINKGEIVHGTRLQQKPYMQTSSKCHFTIFLLTMPPSYITGLTFLLLDNFPPFQPISIDTILLFSFVPERCLCLH